jgi:beta-galactosidase
LRSVQGATIAQGSLAPTDIPTGSLTTLGPIAVDLKSVRKATRLNLEIALRNTDFANDWDVWAFPKPMPAASPANVVVCDRVEAATEALAREQRVLLLANQLGAKTNIRYAQWVPVFFCGAEVSWANPNTETLGALVQNRHPALAGFPTDAHLDWQWFDICTGAHGFVLDDMPPDYRPIVQPVSDFHYNHKLGSIFEFRTKEGGKLLVCGYNLADNLANRPAARQLRQSLMDYASSLAFDPKQEVAPDYLTRLFADKNE